MYVIPDCCLANLACAISVLNDSATSAPFLISEHFELYHRAAVDQWRFNREPSYIYRGKKCLQLHYLSSFSKNTTSSMPMFANGDSEFVLVHMHFIPKLNPVVWASLVRPPFINKVFFPVSISCRFSSLCELIKGLLSAEKGRHLCRQTFRPAVFRTYCRHSFTVPVHISNLQEGSFLMSSFDLVSKLEQGWKCYKILLQMYGL